MDASLPLKPSPLSTREKKALGLIGVFVVFISLFLLVGAGKLLIPLFPLGSLIVGIWLYYNTPNFYISFCLCMWILSPEVRRLIDFQSGYITPAGLAFAAQLVSAVSVITLIKNLPKSSRDHSLPFIICSVVIFYGLMSGLVQNPIRGFLPINLISIWLSPVVFGLHLYLNWRNYPTISQVFQKTFLWLVLFQGIYAIYQFCVAPPWDKFWIVTADVGARGTPEPFGLRVWGTTMGAHNLALILMIGFIMIFAKSTKLRDIILVGLGHIPFLLTTARSLWLGWLAAIIILLATAKPKVQIRILIVLSLVLLICLPLIFIEPFSTTIQSRFSSFENIGDDVSLNSRFLVYDLYLSDALSNPIGKGMGHQVDHSLLNKLGYFASESLNEGTLLQLFYSFGWLGSIPYLLSLGTLIFQLYFRVRTYNDPFLIASLISIVIILMLFFSEFILVGMTGTILWAFIGLGLAARKYHAYSQRLEWAATSSI